MGPSTLMMRVIARPKHVVHDVGPLSIRQSGRIDHTVALVAARFVAVLLQSGEREVAESAQLFGFTRIINERLSPAKRVELFEMLWEVAYADGVLDALEDALLRRLGGLIDVSDHERGAARLRVLARLGIGDPT